MRYDVETGFYYLQSRYYDPETGRFLNADGFISTGQGILSNNMFAYCGNNPVNRADSSGSHWYFLWIDDLFETLFSKQSNSDNTTHEVSYTTENPPKKYVPKTYAKDDVNIYIQGDGSNITGKINVELIPNNKKNGNQNPNIRIHDSYKIRDTSEQRKIIEIIMSNSNFDSHLYTRTKNSYITEWKAHNFLYDLTYFNNYLQNRFGTADLDEKEVIAWDISW